VPELPDAFLEQMVVHGRYGEPCPDRDVPVQRLRAMPDGWPKTLDEVEKRKP